MRRTLATWIVGVVVVLGGVLPGQDVPLQRPEERQLTRRQSQEVYDVLAPIAQPVSPSAVWVWAGGRQLAVGTVVGDGTQVLTKWSEIALARGALQCVGGDGATATATVLGVYVDEDVAMLQLDGARFTPVAWGDGETPGIGRWLVAVSPNGDKPLSVGVVSVEARSLRETDQAYLGIWVDHTYEGDGLMIDSVEESAGARAAGIRAGDVLLELEGKKISGGYELRNLLLGYQPGDRVKAKVQRAGGRGGSAEVLDLEIEIGERPPAPRGMFPQSRLEVMRRMGGDISAVRDGFPMVLQTDMQLKKRQCGGPVVDLDGKVVGLAISRTDRTRSFIIPAAEVVALLGQQPVDPRSIEREAPTLAGPGPGTGGPAPRPRAVPMNPNAAADMRRHLEEMQALLERMEREMGSIGE
mgnify:CR=1 FL=1